MDGKIATTVCEDSTEVSGKWTCVYACVHVYVYLWNVFVHCPFSTNL